MYANVHLGSFQVDELLPATTGEECDTDLLPAASLGCWGDLSSAPSTPTPRVDPTRLALGTILPGDADARTGRSKRLAQPCCCGRRTQCYPRRHHVVDEHTPDRNGPLGGKAR